MISSCSLGEAWRPSSYNRDVDFSGPINQYATSAMRYVLRANSRRNKSCVAARSRDQDKRGEWSALQAACATGEYCRLVGVAGRRYSAGYVL
jgi:hypothetical protein